MVGNPKKTSCEWELKAKLNEEERRINKEANPVIGGSLNDIFNAHESSILTSRSDNPTTIVANHIRRVELVTWMAQKRLSLR